MPGDLWPPDSEPPKRPKGPSVSGKNPCASQSFILEHLVFLSSEILRVHVLENRGCEQ